MIVLKKLWGKKTYQIMLFKLMKLDEPDNTISIKIVKITKKGEDRNITKKKRYFIYSKLII